MAYLIKHYGFVMKRFFSKLMCLPKPVDVTDFCNKTIAYNRLCPFSIYYQSVMFYSTGPRLQRAYLRRGHLKRCYTWVSSGLTFQYYTRLERLARDKHSCIYAFWKSQRKKLYNIDYWGQCNRTNASVIYCHFRLNYHSNFDYIEFIDPGMAVNYHRILTGF